MNEHKDHIQLIHANLTRIPDEKGVYIIHAINQHGQPFQINRFCGVDNSGILYIGQTARQTLRKRIYNLIATLRPSGNTYNHSGALKYRRNEVIRKKLEGYILYVDFEICDSPVEREKELLISYASKYGEYPPLNK